MDAPAFAGASSTADFRAVSASFAPGGGTDATPDVLTRFGVSENWKAVTAVAATSSNAAVFRGRMVLVALAAFRASYVGAVARLQ